MIRSWMKLIWYHGWELFIVIALVLLSLALFPWAGWSYDSAVVNGDGSTTYTIYASGSGDLDDAAWTSDATSWAAAKAGLDVLVFYGDLTTAANGIAGYIPNPGTSYYQVSRTCVPFDTAGITGTVTAATAYVTAGGCTSDDEGVTVFTSGNASLPLASSSFNSWTATEIASRIAWTAPAWYDNTQKTVPLNASGISAVQAALGGNFQLWLLEAKDFDNTAPTVSKNIMAGIKFAENATEEYRPRLEITTAPPENTDLFDDGSIDTKWADTAVAGSGSVTETGGCLTITADDSSLYVLYRQYPVELPLDLRWKWNVGSDIPANVYASCVLLGALDGSYSSEIHVSGGASLSVYRRDVVSGSPGNGDAATLPASTHEIYMRLVAAAGGGITCYYKLTACGSWIELDAPDSPWTVTTEDLYPAMWLGNASGSSQSCSWDWIVDDLEHSGYPACAVTASPVIFCE